MVKIRLSHTGKRNRISYRIIVIEEGKRRDGKHIEIIGHYNPYAHPPELVVKKDRVDYWVSKGAQCTEGVTKLFQKHA